MKAWKNKNTGAVIYVESEMRGAWEPVETTKKTASEKPKATVKKGEK